MVARADLIEYRLREFLVLTVCNQSFIYGLHQAGSSPELTPLEIDLDRVRRSRERGVLGLCQTLKSFRDCKVKFEVYANNPRYTEYLNTLGPLEKPTRD